MINFVKSAENYELEAWRNLFYKILTRRVTDWQRKGSWRQKLRQILNLSQLNEADTEYYDAASNLSHDANMVESELACSQLYTEFESALYTLPARQQEAYLLRQWQGHSTADTALIMQCSESSVKTHYSRAMKQLKQQLGEWINER